MAIPRQKRTLRILCFGDSLTAGYYNYGTAYEPYKDAMSTKLSKAFPNLQIDTEEDGLSGDLVNNPGGRFLRRIEKHFPNKDGAPSPYDWTIVLGGTNDLAYQFTPEKIYAALQQTWAVPLSKGCKVLALTVPETGATGPAKERADAKRNRLNDLIKGHKADNFYSFDFNAVFPYFNMRPEEREKYWDDGLHLTADGYMLMGEKIAGALINIIMPPGRLQMNGERTRKRKFKDDDKTFEEEHGDDAALDHGYIVVRRKDLD
ncbi:putative gdsl-like lipase protein [Phaeoacremonium minimum UCRPA7]|uniref:Putative gdsl-like lipase protein n=1 Tax=Phaeoacremonium minimum (strain UCR-PA7) TaxID=1286976 RepID=R8BB48_PHAM7|nr:putative gdsl-like lipase protein [Phaeoacremonium minimum UCRPA7]EON96515.1 putative gdsl-like lipase protein [Phaeoacremonium minimum UCRPA7]